MKSVLQAGWLLTVAVGNIIVFGETTKYTKLEKWAEYILFASMLVVVSIVFSIMAYFYKYENPVEIEAQFTEKDPGDKDDEKKKKRGSLSSSSSRSDGEEEVRQTKI